MPITAEEARNRAKKIAPEVFPSKTWDCDFLMRGLSLPDRLSLYRELKIEEGQPLPDTFIAALVVRCVIDESHNRIWTDADAATLEVTEPELMAELYPEARRLSGMRINQVDEEKKTSNETPGSNSPTSSAATSESSTPIEPSPESPASN